MRVNGMDVYTVKNALEFAKQFAVQNGPIVLSIDTYRYHGHSMSDPGITYRNSQEVQEVRKSVDCLKSLQTLLVDQGFYDLAQLKEIEKNIKKDIEADVKRAQQCPVSPAEWLTSDIYSQGEEHYIRAPNYEDSLFISKPLIN